MNVQPADPIPCEINIVDGRSFATLHPMLLDSIWRDFRHSLRLLRRSLGFTATAVAVLALGIGANTAIFSVVNTVLLQPLPYPEPDRIVQVMIQTAVGRINMTSASRYAFWRENTAAFDFLAAYDLGRPGVTLPGDARLQYRLLHASADYFPLFGATPHIGRVFSPEEDRPGGAQVAVISYSLWRSRFNGDPNLQGKSLTLDDGVYDIVGVLPPRFVADPPADIWLPLQVNPYSTDHSSRLRVAGRLKPGVTVFMAQGQLRHTVFPFMRQFPGVLGPREGFTAIPLRDVVIGDVGPSLFLLSGAVVFVLLIACANVANLLMARAARRAREIATRAALGAGRIRLLLQLLAESAVLALAGGAIGLWLGLAGVRLLLALNPGNIPRIGELGGSVALDGRVVLFTLAITAITGALFGLIPALTASRVDLSTALNRASAGPGADQNAARRFLVAAETALALVLLVGCGLLIRTFVAMHSTDRGFETSGVIALEMSLTTPRFERTSAVTMLTREAVMRIENTPGVVSVAASQSLPLEPGITVTFNIVRRPLLGSPYHGTANWRSVSLRYFDVFRIELKRGRFFTEEDERGAAHVALINDALARKFWPDGNPLGETVSITGGIRSETMDLPRVIVGIVKDVRDTGLDRPAEPILYVPSAQLPDAMNAMQQRAHPLTWIVRTNGDPSRLSSEIQHKLRVASGGMPFGRIRSMDQVVTESTSRTRFMLLLLSTFAAIALLMAAVGIYGLVSYSVEQRTREIGIRVAIGATPGNVRNLVLGEGLRLALFGIAAGSIAAAWLTKFLEGMIYGVRTWDPMVFAGAAALLACIAVAAAFVPALRATRVDPLVALRDD